MAEEKASAMAWAKLVLGTVIFLAMLVIHTWVKELPYWLFAAPTALWGIDLSSLLPGGKK